MTQCFYCQVELDESNRYDAEDTYCKECARDMTCACCLRVIVPNDYFEGDYHYSHNGEKLCKTCAGLAR
jgi:hypothetical protein